MISRRFTLAALLLGGSAAAQPMPAGVPVGQGPEGDWPFVARFREANAALPAAGPRRVVFMGDSITQGWAAQPYFRDNPDHVGRGISGQTAEQMLVRFRQDVIALQPAVVHIMAGTNDVAGNTGPETDAEFQNYIASMVDLAEAHAIKVVIASIPPADLFPWKPGLEVLPRIKRLNSWLRAYAAERHAIYADYWTVLATPEGAMKPAYAADHVHPNATAYAAMAPVAEAAIAKALGSR